MSLNRCSSVLYLDILFVLLFLILWYHWLSQPYRLSLVLRVWLVCGLYHFLGILGLICSAFTVFPFFGFYEFVCKFQPVIGQNMSYAKREKVQTQVHKIFCIFCCFSVIYPIKLCSCCPKKIVFYAVYFR